MQTSRAIGVLLFTFATIGALAILSGCEGDAPQAVPPRATPPPTTAPTTNEAANVADLVKSQARSGQLPAGHPPLDAGAMGGMGASDGMSGTGAMGAMPADGPPNLAYTAPAAWQRETPNSPMRADQYRLPSAAGAAEDGELAVFRNIGGGIEGNISRWRSQMVTADGKPTPDEAFLRKELDVNGLKVIMVDMAGRYTGAAGMGMGAEVKENYRMLGAIVDTPEGPWFFKAIGPAATMNEHRDAFVEFLQTMRPATGEATHAATASAPAKQ